MNNIEEKLEKKFDPEEWTGYKVFEQYTKTGRNLVDDVNILDPDLVIDVGCGHNRFKGRIKKLIGFDQEPFPFADLHMSIDDINFRPESADVVMCLGSLQFGTRDDVRTRLTKVASWVKPGGYIIMRTMNQFFKDRGYPYQEAHYIWTREDAESLGAENNLTIVKGVWEEMILDATGEQHSTRLSWWYQKPGTLKRYAIKVGNCDIFERR
jgi:ubiquinone/menaquinone biosynthesis C-methylase UbiE